MGMSCVDLVVGSKIGFGSLAANSVGVSLSKEIFPFFHLENWLP